MTAELTSKRVAVAVEARAERLRILGSGLPIGEQPGEEASGRGEETKGRILDTAITLFAERGFDACTMREIASAVGIKAPGIYNHYASKDDVFAAAMEHILGRFFSSLLLPLEGQPVEIWLRSIVRGHVGFQLEHPELARANDALLNAPARQRVLPPPVYRRIVGAERSYVELIATLVRLSVPSTGEQESLLSGYAITAMCDRVVIWYEPEGALGPAQVADRTWKLVARMIGASA